MTKNRFDGTLGKVYLDFNKDSLTMSSYQGSTPTSLKTENKYVRTSKPPKPSLSSKRPKMAGENKDEKLTNENDSPSGNTQKKSLIDKSINNHISNQSVIKLNPNRTSTKALRVKLDKQNTLKGESQLHNSTIVNNEEVSKSDINDSTDNTTSLLKPQAILLKKDESSKGTSLSTKATRFDAQINRRSLLTGKKISVKQLDVNKVYLQ